MSDPPMSQGGSEEQGELTSEDRAAMRAFLQRSEVRLSTMHRVATALLSGAGILVVLPALERDSIGTVLRALLTAPASTSTILLTIGVISAIVLALAVFWLLISELTKFYFHSNHIRAGGHDVYAARFTLTGLRIPSDELSASANHRYTRAHASPANTELLVPDNASVRARIDAQLAAYPGLVDSFGCGSPGDNSTIDLADDQRVTGLFGLAASRRRSLIEEVTKVEFGIVRHVNRLQVIVLRYVKALLVIVWTSIAILVCASAIGDLDVLSETDQRWIAGVLAVWAPAVMAGVAAPVRWLEQQLRAEGAVHSALSADRELTRVERLTNRVATGVWALAATSLIVLLASAPAEPTGLVASVVVLCGSLGFVARELIVRAAGSSAQPVAT